MQLRLNLAGMLLLMCAAACDREARLTQDMPLPESPPALALTAPLRAGDAPAPAPDPRARFYEGNAYEVSEGQRLYEDFNCSTCHAHGGGDIGPALMDAEWTYGGSIEQIVASIEQGRPNGMPSFRGKLTDRQIWETAAYVRALSGQLSKDVPPSRSDSMANIEALTLRKKEGPVDATETDPGGTK